MAENKVHHFGAVSLEVGKTEIGKFETGARKPRIQVASA
jgi:hypothetical protein